MLDHESVEEGEIVVEKPIPPPKCFTGVSRQINLMGKIERPARYYHQEEGNWKTKLDEIVRRIKNNKIYKLVEKNLRALIAISCAYVVY